MDENERTLWCGNISEKVTEAILYELFLQGGPLEKVRIPKDKNGVQRKFAFIVFKHTCSVPYAAALFEGTTLFRRKLALQHRQSVGGDTPNSTISPVHQQALSCPVNLNTPPASTMQPNSQGLLANPFPETIGVQNFIKLYQSQLMSIPVPVGPVGNMGSLAKSSLMGTWNRNHPYTGSLRGQRDHDRHRGSGYNRMEPNSHKKYDREETDFNRKSNRLEPDSHRKYDRMEPDSHKKSDHHARRYHHRRDYH